MKCDLNRPVCLRCQRAGLNCDGPRDSTFVEARIVSSRRKVESPRPSTSSASSTSDAESTESAVILHPSVAPSEKPQEMYIMFARSHLATDGPVDRVLQELRLMDTSCLERRTGSNCKTAHLQAVLSFATIFFGTRHRQADITQHGFASYGTTLQQLNRALTEPNSHESDEIIVSVITLAIQETLVPSGPNQFMNHMQGLERLLALRDPTSFQSPYTVGLYMCLRHMLLFAALVSGRPTILAKPEWKALLRKHCPDEEKLQEQRLYEILADCTVLASERDKLLKRQKEAGEDTHPQMGIVRGSTENLCVHLRSWRTEWGASPRNAFIEIPAPQLAAVDKESAYPTEIVFADIKSALMLMLYNITLMNLLAILISLPPSLQQRHSRYELIPLGHSAVLDICRCLPSSMNDELRKELHASPVVYWAIQTARMTLQGDDSARARWLSEILDRKSAGSLAGNDWEVQ